MEIDAAGRPATALIVEDNQVFRGLLSAMLNARLPAMRVLEAGTVAEGLGKARDHAPELVLMDIQLPDGNGLAATRAITCELPGTCVIVCTSHDLPEYREAARECGAAHFVAKDKLDPRAICDVVRRLLGCDAS